MTTRSSLGRTSCRWPPPSPSSTPAARRSRCDTEGKTCQAPSVARRRPPAAPAQTQACRTPRLHMGVGPPQRHNTCETSSTGWVSTTKASWRSPEPTLSAGRSRRGAAPWPRATARPTVAHTPSRWDFAQSGGMDSQALACQAVSHGRSSGSNSTTATSRSTQRRIHIWHGFQLTGPFIPMMASSRTSSSTRMTRVPFSETTRRRIRSCPSLVPSSSQRLESTSTEDGWSQFSKHSWHKPIS
mmetsp:Transcript_49475/g.152652  ORF Transcript_49475/g.152652 Transcript_49475/m.152652 type:complete len:242 (-) Transcript_49475:230-955(-)